MNINTINNKIKEKGFENLSIEEKKYKTIQIWKDRNRKAKWGGSFKNQDNFVEWYLKQERKCICCNVSEEKVRKYFYNNNKEITRGGKRGQMLELDKIDNFLSNEPYTEENCGLLCYVCNNAKSNFINEYKSFEPIAKGIKKFWENQ